MDEGHLIDLACEFREEVADPASALSVLPEWPVATLAVAGLGGEELHLAVGIERLALTLRQLGLMVPRIHVAQAARAEDLDDRLGLGRMVQSAASGRGGRGLRLIEHRRKGDAPETAAEFPEEIATADHALATIAEVGRVHGVIQRAAASRSISSILNRMLTMEQPTSSCR